MGTVIEFVVAAPPSAIRELVLQTFDSLGWKFRQEDGEGGWLMARTPGGFLSWGEEVTVVLGAEGLNTRVRVKSEPIAQVVDWGRSRENVATMRRAIVGDQGAEEDDL